MRTRRPAAPAPTGRLALTLVLAACLAALPAAAQDAPPAADPCAREAWLLEGASGPPGDGHAAWLPAWTPVLEEVAACLRTAPLAEACLVVRGLTDALPFGAGTAGAFGSDEAAQLARGQGRALTVQARLEAMGVPPQRLRAAAAAVGAPVRGVELRLVPGCLAAAEREGLGQAEVEALVDRRVALALAARAPGPPPPAPPPPAGPRPPRAWLDAGLDLTLLAGEPDLVLAPVLSAGAGLEWRALLARLGAGVAVGHTRAARTGFEASALAGGRLASGLELGGEVRWRLASLEPGGPWLDQALTLGARLTACPAALERGKLRLCLSAFAEPLGWRWRQGAIRRGEALPGPRTDAWAGLVGVGAALRWGP